MNQPRIFDAHHYESLNSSRADVVSNLISQLKIPNNLQSAIDVGCGLGYFSGLLSSLGLQVTAVDGRLENAEEASRRFSSIRFHQCDAEDFALRNFGQFDLVFCFGLLYHLQNPLLTISHLYSMTKTLLLIEGVIFPGSDPIMGLVDEGLTEDQGLQHFAFYPTEACLKKMLFRVGFPHVYEFAIPPAHPGYHQTSTLPKVRTMLAASHRPVQSNYLRIVAEPKMSIQPWDAESSADYLLRQQGQKPLVDKLKSLGRRIQGK